MTQRKKKADFRRRYSEKRGHYKRLFNYTTLGIALLVVFAALAVNASGGVLCGETCGSFAGWVLVVIGYVPLLAHALARVAFGGAFVVIPSSAWHLAVADLVFLAFSWALVRWIARSHSSEFLRRAWHLALILFCWGAFQLTTFALATLWRQGGVHDTAQHYRHCAGKR